MYSYSCDSVRTYLVICVVAIAMLPMLPVFSMLPLLPVIVFLLFSCFPLFKRGGSVVSCNYFLFSVSVLWLIK